MTRSLSSSNTLARLFSGPAMPVICLVIVAIIAGGCVTKFSELGPDDTHRSHVAAYYEDVAKATTDEEIRQAYLKMEGTDPDLKYTYTRERDFLVAAIDAGQPNPNPLLQARVDAIDRADEAHLKDLEARGLLTRTNTIRSNTVTGITTSANQDARAAAAACPDPDGSDCPPD